MLKDNSRRPLIKQEEKNSLCFGPRLNTVENSRLGSEVQLAPLTCLICFFIKVNGYLNITGLQNGNEGQAAKGTAALKTTILDHSVDAKRAFLLRFIRIN